MLSKDEIIRGIPFILKLQDAAGISFEWVATLCGEAATRWYAIYQKSDWNALRRQASETFRNRVTQAEAETVRRSGRCIVIKTPLVKVEELLIV